MLRTVALLASAALASAFAPLAAPLSDQVLCPRTRILFVPSAVCSAVRSTARLLPAAACVRKTGGDAAPVEQSLGVLIIILPPIRLLCLRS